MALVSTSQVVTDQSATPIVKVNAHEKGGVVRTAQGFIAAASFTGGTVGQWYTFVRVPARARVIGVFISATTSSTGAVKAGLYRPDGIAIDDDSFAAIHVMGAATNIRARVDTNTVYTPSLRRDVLSTAFVTAVSTAGATGDVEYDIALAVVTVIGTPVDTLVEVDYVLPE
jgi:hypothetical protein